MDQVFLFVYTKLASTESFVCIIAVLCIWLLRHQHRRDSVLLALSTAGLMASVTIAKLRLAIPRPAEALFTLESYGFPSGHAAGAMFLGVVFAALTLKSDRVLRMLVLTTVPLAVIAVGGSRVLFGVHSVPQVIGGYAFGAFWALLFVWLSRRWKMLY